MVVEKPVNIPVQADASGDMDLLNLCKGYIKEKYNKPGEVFLGLVHRLDRPVGGVMVFARTSKAAARLTEQFKTHKAQKRYVALVQGEAPAYESLKDHLLKDEKTNTTAVVPEGTPGSKEARLSYSCIGREQGCSLLDIELQTGRPHQIRVQLSHRGYPLLGDQRYNKNAKMGEQICLWAYSLQIQHPTLGESMGFYSTPPWKVFPTQLKYLPARSVCYGVYEDEDILVVDKNRGAEVEGELLGQLSAILSPLYPVHRLDSQTLGLVVLAKNHKSREALEEAFYRHDTDKRYEAVLFGIPKPEQASLLQYAKKDSIKQRMFLVDKGAKDAVSMSLDYTVIQKKPPLCKVQLRLHTGRTHQIRLQMASLGTPVLGDDKYGSYEANKRYKQRAQLLLSKELTVLGKHFVSLRELPFKEL